mgnify:CR=1 FL=1
MLITVMVNTLFTPERISRNKRSLLWKAPLNWMELPAKLLVMPYYTISVGLNPDGADIANSYNRYLITDQLREKYGYDGVVCTDWGITGDETGIETFAGKPWGAEELSVAERHYRILMAGVDQFGGNNDKGPVLEAYKMGVEEMGEPAMRERFETSAVRLLLNIFRTGLFAVSYTHLTLPTILRV